MKSTRLIAGMVVAGNLVAKEAYTVGWELLAKHEAGGG